MRAGLAIAVFALAVRLAPAGSVSVSSPGGAAPPAGELALARADTMDGLLHAWALGFRRQHPDVELNLHGDTKLSAEAFAELLAGRVQIAPFVRELFPSEVASFRKQKGHDPMLVAVATGSYATKSATHALAIYVAAANPLARLTLTQLRGIYAQDGRIRTWGQLGLAGRWASRPIHVYGMPTRRATGNPPGIVNFIQQRVLRGAQFRRDLTACVDTPGRPSLDGIVHAVAADPEGLGCSGFGNAQPGTKTLALAEDEAGPYFTGTPAEVARRVYPLTRTIYLCLDHARGQPLDPRVGEFFRYVLGPEGQRRVADDAEHFLPLPLPLRAAELEKLR